LLSESGLPKAILQMSSMLEFSNGGARSISHFPKTGDASVNSG
jgi:hypothetical protein